MSKEIFERIESKIVSAEIKDAQDLLLRYIPKNLDVFDATQACNLARRAGLIEYSIRILRPHVRSENPEGPIDPRAQLEYGASLSLVGAVRESQNLLKANLNLPLAKFQLALSYLREWDHHLAVPIFLDLLETWDCDEYRRLVLKLNLISCYVTLNELHLLPPLLESVEAELKSEKFPLLLLHVTEQRLLYHLSLKETSQSRKLLNRLEGTELASHPLHGSSLRKWRTFIAALENPSEAPALFKELRKVSRSELSWSVLRECDFYEALVTGDLRLAEKLWVGTPFPGYRARMTRTFGELKGALGTDYLRVDTDPPLGSESLRIFNLLEARVDDLSEKGIARASLPHFFVLALCRDFYQPILKGRLFEKLYPGEFYDVRLATKRIENIHNRVNHWISESGLSWSIQQVDKGFFLTLGKGDGIRIKSGLANLDFKSWEELELYYLSQWVGSDETFKIQRAENILKSEASVVRRLLARGCEIGSLSKEKKGRGFEYQFVKAKTF